MIFIAATQKACCFTGYRPEKFPFPFTSDHVEYARFENRLLESIFSLPAEEYMVFYSGVAMGFDLVAAELVLLYRDMRPGSVRLICVVPFKRQSDNWSEDWKQRYEHVLANADDVIVLSEEYYKGCFQKRNEYMVNHSDLVVTYYDGKSGGTSNTLFYAARKGLTILNLADETIRSYSYHADVEYLYEESDQQSLFELDE